MQQYAPVANESVTQAKDFIASGPLNQVRNLFYVMTCVATFTCIIRSDYNFAFGLLGYYMIKTANPKKMLRPVQTVSRSLTLIIYTADVCHSCSHHHGYLLGHDDAPSMVQKALK